MSKKVLEELCCDRKIDYGSMEVGLLKKLQEQYIKMGSGEYGAERSRIEEELRRRNKKAKKN